MYEMQGPHVAEQLADQPISRPPVRLARRTAVLTVPHNVRLPGPRATLGVAPEVVCCSGGE
jgi:hypothetical protein